MKISIITSCFNREATIGQAIESVLSQDYPDIEYIVVDGASKDRSLEVINRYKDRISKIISEPDKGMYEGINKGIKAATGDIIGLLHSDDFLYAKDTISRMAQEFERTGADFVYGNSLFVDPDNRFETGWEEATANGRYATDGCHCTLHATSGKNAMTDTDYTMRVTRLQQTRICW